MGSMEENKPTRRWFQISLREAALAVVAAGFAFAWYCERQALAPARRYIEQIRSNISADPFMSPQESFDSTIGGYPVTITVFSPGMREQKKHPIAIDDDIFAVPPRPQPSTPNGADPLAVPATVDGTANP